MTIIDVDFLCDIYDLSMCERSKWTYFCISEFMEQDAKET